MYDTKRHTKVAMEYHRTNIQDEYNYGMNKIDLGDQLRNYYCMDRWKRQFKWWFALWMWGFEVSLVNAYITYTKMRTNLYKIEKKYVDTLQVSEVGSARVDQSYKVWPKESIILRSKLKEACYF